MAGMVTVFPSRVLIFKTMLRSDIRLFALAEHAATLERVTEMVRYYFELSSAERFNVYYVNTDGEMIRMRSEMDFADACWKATATSDLERELVLIVDYAPSVDVEFPGLARLSSRMQQLEADLLTYFYEINGSVVEEGNLLPSTLQLPRWVAREGLHYETVRAETPSALSDIEEREVEADLLPSPRLTIDTFLDNEEQPPSSPQIEINSAFLSTIADFERRFGYDRPPSPGEVIYEDDFEFYEDDEEAEVNQPSLTANLVSPAKETKFQVPFPAFVPFPPSPNTPAPVFTLSETTPFPFPATMGKLTCTCKCTCSPGVPATSTTVNVGTDVVVARIAGKHSEPRPFRFFVSVSTQCHPLPSLANSVSIGTQSEIAPVDTGYENIGTGTVSTQTATDPWRFSVSTGTQHVAQASALSFSAVISVPISKLEAAGLSDVSQIVEDMPPEEAVAKHDGTEQTSPSEDIDAEYDII